MVVNISNVPLSQSEINRLISRSLNLPQTIQNCSVPVEGGCQAIFRRLRLRKFSYNPEDTSTNEINPFKRKSKWTLPINREPALETFVRSV